MKYYKTGQINRETREFIQNYGMQTISKLEATPCHKTLIEHRENLIKTLKKFLRELEYTTPITITPYFSDVAIIYLSLLLDIEACKEIGLTEELAEDAIFVIMSLCNYGNINVIRIVDVLFKQLNQE